MKKHTNVTKPISSSNIERPEKKKYWETDGYRNFNKAGSIGTVMTNFHYSPFGLRSVTLLP